MVDITLGYLLIYSSALHPFDSTEFTIDHMFVWMLRQCGSPKTECRHKCMELLYNLLPTQPGKVLCVKFFKNDLLNLDSIKNITDLCDRKSTIST